VRARPLHEGLGPHRSLHPRLPLEDGEDSHEQTVRVSLRGDRIRHLLLRAGRPTRAVAWSPPCQTVAFASHTAMITVETTTSSLSAPLSSCRTDIGWERPTRYGCCVRPRARRSRLAGLLRTPFSNRSIPVARTAHPVSPGWGRSPPTYGEPSSEFLVCMAIDTWSSFQPSMKVSIAAMRSWTLVNVPRRIAWRVMIPKKISTMFSRDPRSVPRRRRQPGSSTIVDGGVAHAC
jgi:hypothetical protein